MYQLAWCSTRVPSLNLRLLSVQHLACSARVHAQFPPGFQKHGCGLAMLDCPSVPMIDFGDQYVSQINETKF